MDPEFVRELFSEFGAVELRRMFGGAGLYADGLMFGLVTGGSIYLKADESSILEFEAENCAPFAYGTRTGRRAVMSYWRLPNRLYDDPDELARWARTALSVARRSAERKASTVPNKVKAPKPAKKPPTKKTAAKKRRR